VFNALFGKKTIYALFVFTFYSVLNEYIDSASDPDLLRADIEEFKQIRRYKINENKNPANQIAAQFEDLDEELVQSEIDLQEYKINIGNAEELKERVCQLLLGYLEIEEKNKIVANFSYEKIMKLVRRDRDKEKHSIVEELGNLSIEQRRIEDMLKKYKIGRWNVGQQKGLVQYDAATNERETNEMLGRMLGDAEENDMKTLMMEVYDRTELADEEAMVDVEELDAYKGDATEGYYDGEGEDIHEFGDEYGDGVYYEEDHDNTFSEEY
jgi:hypothetical protein